jgi:hypothetical protein
MFRHVFVNKPLSLCWQTSLTMIAQAAMRPNRFMIVKYRTETALSAELQAYLLILDRQGVQMLTSKQCQNSQQAAAAGA